jgi:hypothetical protein
MVYEENQSVQPYVMTDMQPMACNTFDDLLHQLNLISEETLDDTAQVKKNALLQHNLKPALFTVLCEIKDKTALQIRSGPEEQSEDPQLMRLNNMLVSKLRNHHSVLISHPYRWLKVLMDRIVARQPYRKPRAAIKRIIEQNFHTSAAHITRNFRNTKNHAKNLRVTSRLC